MISHDKGPKLKAKDPINRNIVDIVSILKMSPNSF